MTELAEACPPFILECSHWDYYSYNMPGPYSIYSGGRSHFQVHVNKTSDAKIMFQCSEPLRRLIIVRPNGTVAFKRKYKGQKLFLDALPGKYLFKAWWDSTVSREGDAHRYTMTWKGVGIESVSQMIWSPGVSNKESLFDKGPTLTRKNGIFSGAPQTRRDRCATNQR